jgi:hypothetical protein
LGRGKVSSALTLRGATAEKKAAMGALFSNPVRGHADVTRAQKEEKKKKRCRDFHFQVRLRHESGAEQVAGR